MAKAKHLHRVRPGTKVDLGAIDPEDISAAPGDKVVTAEATAMLAVRLAELQKKLWAGSHRSLLVVLQGMDTSGKGGTVEHVLGVVNPVGLRVVSFKAPSSREMTRDFLWRVHARVPGKGEIGVFDRSHYEDVLVVRVEELVAKSQWRARYDHIKGFEQLLVDEGTAVVKVFLHISEEQQRERLQARLDNPEKRWKFNVGDLDARKRWHDYQAAYEEAIERTATEHAPWHIVPANKKWYRDWAVATILVDELEAMGLRWPEPEDLDGIVIP